VLREKRPALEGELGAQVDALLDKASDQLVIGDVRDLESAALAHEVADKLRLHLGIALSGAGLSELGGQFRELLGRQGVRARTREEARPGAESFDPRLSLRDPGPQAVDVLAEPGGGGARQILFVVFLLRR
jgi:hypothetical protein